MSGETGKIESMREELSKVNVQKTGWALRVIFKVLFGILALLEQQATQQVAEDSVEELVYEALDVD